MERIAVSESKEYLECGGRGFFYLADTVWAAFTAPTMEEWKDYLDYRKLQGFNVLQINVLPQWDAGGQKNTCEPFAADASGTYDFHSINAAYFDRACALLRAAADRGFVPALVLLWCNYVPDTWGAKKIGRNIMPQDAVAPYVSYAVNRFREFRPIYIVSGDTDFPTERACLHYRTALRAVKELDPFALTTMHIQGERSDLPEEFVRSKDLDFYTYQSSHNAKNQHLAYHLAEAFTTKSVRKPVINAEPCYEGSRHWGEFPRFTAYDVRKAIWQSLLSGANAGVAYGAHGIWNFYRAETSFESADVTGIPFRFRDALRLEGAWDAGFARWIFETFGLFGMKPLPRMDGEPEETRFAASADGGKLVGYIPYAADSRVPVDLSDYHLTAVDLENRRFLQPAFIAGKKSSVLKMVPVNSDFLLIGTKTMAPSVENGIG